MKRDVAALKRYEEKLKILVATLNALGGESEKIELSAAEAELLRIRRHIALLEARIMEERVGSTKVVEWLGGHDLRRSDSPGPSDGVGE